MNPLLLALLLAQSVASPEGPRVAARLLAGGGLEGRLLGIREGRALLVDAQGTRLDPLLASLEALEFSPLAQPEGPLGPALHLATGESIPVDQIEAGPRGGLIAAFRGRPLQEVPLDRLRGARLHPPPGGGDGLTAALAGPPPEGRDLLFLMTENGPLEVAGTMLRFEGASLLAEIGGRENRLPLSRLQGFVAAAGAATPPSPPPPAEAVLACGALLRGAARWADATTLRLEHPLLGPISIPWTELSALLCSRDRVLGLSSAALLADRAVPAFDRVWPVARDRTLEGRPIVLGQTVYRTGFCFLPRRALTFAVPKGFTLFGAVLGFAPEAGGSGAARFRVLAGTRVLFDRILRGSDPPLPVSIDLSGAESLTLEADFGPGLHVGDHCVFAAPRLIAPPGKE